MGELIGLLAGIATAVVFIPQAVQVIRDKNLSGLSLSSYLIYCIGMLLWMLYGAYLHSAQMVIFNFVSLIFASIILCLIIQDRIGKK